MIKNIVILLISIYLLIFIRIFYIENKKKNNELVGGDSSFICKDYSSFYIVNYKFNKKISDKFFEKKRNFLLDKMKEDPKNTMFLKVNYKSKYYKYRDLSNRKERIKLVDNILVKKPISKKWGDWDIKDLPIKFFLCNDYLSILCLHTFMDGYTLFSKYFVGVFLNDTHMIDIKLPKFRYIPLVTEYSLLKGYIKIHNLPSQNLHLVKWNKRKSSRSIRSKLKMDYVKKNKLDNNVNYSTSLASIYLSKLFSGIKKKIKKLNVCFIYTLNNNTNFNNFGVISFKINRTSNVEDLCKQLMEGLKNNKSSIFSSYIFSNLFGFTNNFYDKIDCVFSFIPASNGYFKSGDYKIIDGELIFPFTTASIYVYSSSYYGYENTTFNINSNDVDKTKVMTALREVCDNVRISRDYIKE
jgi:hypothetical protein